MKSNTVPDAHCPHLHQDYPGVLINKCLDCGKSSLPDAPPPERLRQFIESDYSLIAQSNDGDSSKDRDITGDVEYLLNDIAARSEGEAAESSCDHCSADLGGTKHVLCEECYRRFDSGEYDRATAGLSEAEKNLYPRHPNDPAAFAPATDEVERATPIKDALVELREMFNGETNLAIQRSGGDGHIASHGRLEINKEHFVITRRLETIGRGDTLTEAMQAVREWSKEKS